jgi:hypothetical protein
MTCSDSPTYAHVAATKLPSRQVPDSVIELTSSAGGSPPPELRKMYVSFTYFFYTDTELLSVPKHSCRSCVYPHLKLRAPWPLGRPMGCKCSATISFTSSDIVDSIKKRILEDAGEFSENDA